MTEQDNESFVIERDMCLNGAWSYAGGAPDFETAVKMAVQCSSSIPMQAWRVVGSASGLTLWEHTP